MNFKNFSFFLLLLLSACSRHTAPQPAQPPMASATPYQPGAVTTPGFTIRIDEPAKLPAATPQRYKVSFEGELTLTPIDGGTVTPPVDPPKDTVVVVPPVEPPTNPGTLTENNFGINTHPWHAPKTLNPFKYRRVYLSSYYFWRPDGFKPQPMHQGGTPVAWGLDDCFKNIKDAGGIALACIHQTPEWFYPSGSGVGGGDLPPSRYGANRALPASYKEYAELMFQVAAREGRKTWPLSALKISKEVRWTGDENTPKSGLGYLEYIEPWNEPDKWWKKGTPEYMEPEYTAALMSACYDGHEGTLGQYAGIKTADPTMKVVMPGLTDYDWPYVAAMDVWFKTNRKDKKWPCDVFNMHHYLNTGNVLGKHPQNWDNSGGALPGQDAAFVGVRPFIGFAKVLGMPFWLTETGYDSGINSQMSVGTEEKQGLYLIESVKAFVAEGVQVVILYNGANEPNAEQPGAAGGLWQTAGLLKSQAANYAPKKSMDILAAYISSLKPKAAAKSKAKPKQQSREKPLSVPPITQPKN